MSLESSSTIRHSVSSIQHPVVSGVVLAGGAGKRMGRDKRFLELGGVSLLEHVLARLRPIVGELIIVTREPEDLQGLDARVVSDRFPGMGVLAGVHAGLRATHTDWAFVVGGDMPLLSCSLLTAMAAWADDRPADVVVPQWNGMLEPLHGLYRAAICARAAERGLRLGRRRIVSFYPDVRVCVVPEEEVRRWDPRGESFFNVNTPKEWRAAQAQLGSRLTANAEERPEGLSS